MSEVRVYSHAGLIRGLVTAGGSTGPSSDSLFLLKLPYLSGEVLTPTTSVAAHSLAATAPAGTNLLQVQLEDNTAVHFEVTPEGHTLREATTASPLLKNDTVLSFQAGYRLSVLEKT